MQPLHGPTPRGLGWHPIFYGIWPSKNAPEPVLLHVWALAIAFPSLQVPAVWRSWKVVGREWCDNQITLHMSCQSLEPAASWWVCGKANASLHRSPPSLVRVKKAITTHLQFVITNMEVGRDHSPHSLQTWGTPVEAGTSLPTHLLGCCRLWWLQMDDPITTFPFLPAYWGEDVSLPAIGSSSRHFSSPTHLGIKECVRGQRICPFPAGC